MNKPYLVWIGRALSLVVCIPFAFSATLKFFPSFYPQMGEQMAQIGIPMSLLIPIGILEVTCVVIYLIPPTSVLGAILFTGYIGGAMMTHLRVGENVLMHVILGLVIWLGIYLREQRLRQIIPIRKLD